MKALALTFSLLMVTPAYAWDSRFGPDPIQQIRDLQQWSQSVSPPIDYGNDLYIPTNDDIGSYLIPTHPYNDMRTDYKLMTPLGNGMYWGPRQYQF